MSAICVRKYFFQNQPQGFGRNFVYRVFLIKEIQLTKSYISGEFVVLSYARGFGKFTNILNIDIIWLNKRT